jgi:hypothetical protein
MWELRSILLYHFVIGRKILVRDSVCTVHNTLDVVGPLSFCGLGISATHPTQFIA